MIGKAKGRSFQYVPDNSFRFCGINLNSAGTPASNAPIITCDLPFELSHITGITDVGTTNVVEVEDGFSLSYTQLQGNC